MIERELKKLNEKQLEAVETIYWPAMVVAWPWTGKTQIIWLRTANIILKTWINPENILITTFTEAWVIAIRKRLVDFIGTDAYKVWVSTIHSFAQDVISSFPEKFIEEKAANNIDDIESLEILTNLIDENIKSWNIEFLFTPFDRFLYLRDIKSRIWKLKWEWINSIKFEKIIIELRNEYDQKLDDLKNNKRIRDLEKRTKKDSETYKKHIWKLTELNLIYKQYQEYLKNNSLYDFSDMINFVVEKFKIDKDLTSFYAEKYQFIMLDEYQDTNNPQNEIMDLILEIWEEKNIMVVWDDDQSIYRFQWANIENMLDFYNKYPKTKFIVLENNYRSTQPILNLASSLITNNNERLVNKLKFLEKKLISQVKNDWINNYYILPSEETEKIFILEEIKKKTSPQPSPQGEDEDQSLNKTFAIIVRSNKEVEEWTNFMQIEWIEVESKLKTNILVNNFVNFILDFLKIVENPYYDDEKLLNILRSEIIDINNIDVIQLSRELYKKNYTKNWFKLKLWDLIKNISLENNLENFSENQVSINYKNIEKIINFKILILELNEELWTYWISKLFQKIIDKLNIVNYIELNGDFNDLEDIFTLFNKIKEINSKNKDLNISSLIKKFELHKKYSISIPRQILKKTKSNIEILTAHSAKWLEYDYVYIPWVYWWNWENKKITDKLKLPLWVAWDWLQYSELSEKELKNIEKEINLEEDRRLFFVAITRAKNELIFTRSAWKNNKPFIDSPFMIEIWINSNLIEKLNNNDILTDSIKKQLIWNTSLIKTTSEEINYINEFLQNYKLSPTDLNTFLEDPKKFLQNVIFKYPFVDNEFTIFGKIYHRILELITWKQILWEKIELWYLTETFSILLDKQVLTQEEKNRLLKKWIEWLTGYFENFKKNTRIPLATEYNFRSRNIVFDWIPITWKIDKIEEIWEWLNSWNFDWQWALFLKDIAIIDYKTWWIKTEWNIKWIDRYWNIKPWFETGKYFRQLLFYKLLWENDPEFNSKFNINELALDFVEWKEGMYQYLPINIEQEDYENFKKLVKESWEKINNLDYWKEILNN